MLQDFHLRSYDIRIEYCHITLIFNKKKGLVSENLGKLFCMFCSLRIRIRVAEKSRILWIDLDPDPQHCLYGKLLLQVDFNSRDPEEEGDEGGPSHKIQRT